jgi:hypothetical protein
LSLPLIVMTVIIHVIGLAVINERIVQLTHWQLMGTLEALNGIILFGLTTAFPYGTIR